MVLTSNTRDMSQLIRGTNSFGEHDDTKVDSEFVRTHLFLIAEVLNKINESDRQSDEKIRENSDDKKDRLAEVEKRLEEMQD